MSIDELEHLAADLRREADRRPLDALSLSMSTPAELVQRAGKIPRRVINVAGVEIRLQLTRTGLGTREFYQLSIGGPMLKYVPKELVDRIVAAFMADPVPIRSMMGNCFQYIEEIEAERTKKP